MGAGGRSRGRPRGPASGGATGRGAMLTATPNHEAAEAPAVDFFPYEPFDSNGAQTYVWDSLKAAFRGAGVAYYRYHIFPRGRRRRRELDVLLLHPELGVCVVE